MTLRCALIGTGNWATTALLPALRAQSGVQVVACVGASMDESRRFAEEQSIPRPYATLDELLGHEKLELTVVSTPDHLHAEAVSASLEAGIASYCEKPISNDAPVAHELAALQRRTKVPATVGYSFRFNPAIQALKADLQAGVFGDIWLIELAEHNPQFHPHSGKPMNWKGDPNQAAGGALFEYGSHVIDMGAWLLGPISRVSSSLKRVLPGARLDDIATLQLDFECGAQGTLVSSWVLSGGFPGTRVKVHGSEAVGEVHIDHRLAEGQSYFVAPACKPGGGFRQIDSMNDRRSDAATRHIAAFIGYVRDQTVSHPSLPTLSQAAHVQDVLAASLRAENVWQEIQSSNP